MPGNPVDVVTGQKIVSTWGNQIRDQTVQPFASAAARDAAITAPKRGQFCVVVDTLQQYIPGSGWAPVSIRGLVVQGSAAGGLTIPVSTGMTVASYPLPALSQDYWAEINYQCLFSSTAALSVQMKAWNPGPGLIFQANRNYPLVSAFGAAVQFSVLIRVGAPGGVFTVSVDNVGTDPIGNYSDPSNNQAYAVLSV